MLKRYTLWLLAAAFCCTGCFLISNTRHAQIQAPVGEEEEGPEKEARIRAYNELIHRAAPGSDWRAIEAANALANEQYKISLAANKTAAAFAGGLLNGAWYERGNKNTAGRMSSFAYEPTGNTLYGMSDAGTLWKTNPPTGSWTLLNDDYQLESKVLAITSITGGTRILMGRDTNLVYTDNYGATIQAASGINFPVAWGGNKINKIVVVNDAVHSVYALVAGWNSSPWAARVWLYRSVDGGQSFSKIFTFSNDNTDQVSLFSPLNTSQLYALAVNPTTSDSLFTISGNSVTLLNATTTFPAAAAKSVLTGLLTGTQLQLYALVADSLIYQSANSGSSWSYVNTASGTSWHLLSASTKVPGNIFYGNVEAFRSTNSGATFTKVNNWGDYYATPASKLHADIQAISFFQDAGGSEFCMIGTDGGAYFSGDYLGSVTNISLNGLKVNQLWNHISDPDDPATLFSGMQDQGLCHTLGAGGTGLISQNQIISGDYGQMCISGGGILWAEYPGGNMYLYTPLANPQFQTTYNLKGSQKSNAAWMMPTCTIPGIADQILLGGGNISGGAGSYLTRLTFTSGTVTDFQYPFNFRTASANGTSGLSSIAISGINKKLWYAATEDGTFFWSNNSGTSWTKTASFAGTSGFWLYGAAIAPSKVKSGTVYYGGSGYSNAGIFVSRDSGLTFTAMNTGLPKTLINSLAVSRGDSMIFAATDAGPYVFITAQQQWYPLIDANTPGCSWKTAEYLPSINTVRFSTYGRGVWDFVISYPTNPNSVAPVAAANAVQVYPNPAASGGLISIGGLAIKPARISILDIFGRLVFTQQWGGAGPLRLPELRAGNYLYLLRQDEQTFTGKLNIR